MRPTVFPYRILCHAAAVCALAGLAGELLSAGEQQRNVELQVEVADSDGELLPCRIHLYDSEDRPQRAPDLPFWRDHFVCGGRVSVVLPPGRYRYEIERGPEYERSSGSIDLSGDRDHALALSLERVADLHGDGWYSGDLHVHRDVGDVPLLMQAEDLDVAPVITWWNKRNLWRDEPSPERTLRRTDDGRFYDVMAGEDEREGGALLYFGLKTPLDIATDSREFPSPTTFVAAARDEDPDVWIDIEKPFWWDVPLWLASGKMNSIGLANNHMCRSRMYESEAWGRPRDTDRLPAPLGNGVLDAGDLLPRAQQRVADSPVGGERLGSVAEPRGLQPRLRSD